MTLAAIWAQDRKGVIGLDTPGGPDMPWHLPAEARHFRSTTLGAAVVMGRRTWESLPERFRPLPKRRNVVVSRNADYDAPGAEVVTCAAAAAAIPSETGTTWVMGGATIYAELLPFCERLVISEVDVDAAADLAVRQPDAVETLARAPRIDPEVWELLETGPWQAGEFPPPEATVNPAATTSKQNEGGQHLPEEGTAAPLPCWRVLQYRRRRS